MNSYQEMEIGLGGHYKSFEGSNTSVIKKLKKVQQELSACPINYNTPTTLTELTFRKTCLAFQKRAGLTSNNVESKHRHSEIVGGHFKSKNKSLCSRCNAGKSVRDDRRLTEPPSNITIDNDLTHDLIPDPVPDVPPTRRRVLN